MAAQAAAFVVHTGDACPPGGPLRLGGGKAAVCACKGVNGDLTNGENIADLGGAY